MTTINFWNEVNNTQTFSKHLLGTYRMLGFGLNIPKQNKRHGPCPHGAHSLAEADKQSQIQRPSTREALWKEGLVLPGGCRAASQGRDNGAGPWMRSSSPDGGGGGSTFQAEETAHEQAES